MKDRKLKLYTHLDQIPQSTADILLLFVKIDHDCGPTDRRKDRRI